MTPTEPLALHHTWPLWEAPGKLELGCILNCAITDALEPSEIGELGAYHAGLWECDLADNSLIWSGGVYDIFGIARGIQITREEAVRFYCEPSRAAMERLRAYAIKHRRGFTIDVQIEVGGVARWMRLIGTPVCMENRVTRLQGLKMAL